MLRHLASFSVLLALLPAQRPDWEGGDPDGCTSITVGRKASADGSVMTSHTCDSHRTAAHFGLAPAKDHAAGAAVTLVKRVEDDTKKMPTYGYVRTGEIPQVARTFGYIDTPYPCMNERQLAIGESTFGGREELQSDNGLIDCQQLVQLVLARCTTAREAIVLGGELLARHGYNDAGECLTIADTKEVWHLEITGPGKGEVGAIWVAQRVPDGHVSVNANASRIRQIRLDDPANFLASANVLDVARARGWWNPADGPFEFCYAYAPKCRASMAARRREWRVLSLMAPSLQLDANAENYPFSVAPEQPVTLAKMVECFQDWYEGTPFDFVKDITVTDKDGKTVVSPFANPFMPYDMNKVFKVNGGWGWRGERTIARWYTMYATITQSRDWLPDPIGGVVWFAWDNVATSIYTPLYCSITDLPASFRVPGRETGFTRDSAWWGFNRLSTLAAQRWGDMRKDVDAVWRPMQQELFANRADFERRARELFATDPERAREMLTRDSVAWGEKVVARAWQLGDELWTKYDEKF